MESHHPTELGVVKRVRMEGVRVTFFVLTVAIEAISTMEILVSRLVMGDGHGVPSYGHHHGPHDYPPCCSAAHVTCNSHWDYD